MGIVDGILGAGASVWNSAKQAKVARQNTERTIQAQRELAEYSYNKDVEMWNMANEYNAPSAQMDRLNAAGLNPNMVYGSGTVAGNTSTQTPKYQAFNPQYNNRAIELPNMLNVLAMYQDVRVKKAQVDNVQEEVIRKKIENSYLDRYLFGRNLKTEYGNIRTAGEIFPLKGETVGSLFDRRLEAELAKTQASTKNVLQDTILKSLEQKLNEKGVSRSDNLLLRMLIQSGMFDKAKALFGNN